MTRPCYLRPAWPNASAIVRLCSAVPKEFPLCFDGTRYEIDFEALQAATSCREPACWSIPLLQTPWVGWQPRKTRNGCLSSVEDKAFGCWQMRFMNGCTTVPHVAPSILRKCQPNDMVVVAHSFSKSYCMTGWRLGWVAGRSDLVR